MAIPSREQMLAEIHGRLERTRRGVSPHIDANRYLVDVGYLLDVIRELTDEPVPVPAS